MVSGAAASSSARDAWAQIRVWLVERWQPSAAAAFVCSRLAVARPAGAGADGDDGTRSGASFAAVREQVESWADSSAAWLVACWEHGTVDSPSVARVLDAMRECAHSCWHRAYRAPDDAVALLALVCAAWQLHEGAARALFESAAVFTDAEDDVASCVLAELADDARLPWAAWLVQLAARASAGMRLDRMRRLLVDAATEREPSLTFSARLRLLQCLGVLGVEYSVPLGEVLSAPLPRVGVAERYASFLCLRLSCARC